MRQWTKKQREFQAALMRYISSTPELLSLLYDMDLLPEQLEDGSKDWRRMILLAHAWRSRKVSA